MAPGDALNAAIVLTPASSAAIAVVRLRGPGVGAFLGKYFSKKAQPGKCVHGELRDGEIILDDPVVVLAEDASWVDISLHGGPWVVRSVLDLAGREGFSILSSSAPVTEAALDDAASPLEREMLAHLPLARTKLAIRALLAQPMAWKNAANVPLDIQSILLDLSLYWQLNPPQIAIVGEPNVGKSTLANQLFGQERSITADLPGTTRDWVGEIADIEGLAAILVDTPGQRITEDPLEKAAIAGSAEKIRRSDLILNILDATRVPREIPTGGILIINKIDQSPAWDIPSINAIRISAKSGQGLNDLRKKIGEHFGVRSADRLRPCWWTERQRQILIGNDRQTIAHEFGLEPNKIDLRDR